MKLNNSIFEISEQKAKQNVFNFDNLSKSFEIVNKISPDKT